MSKTKFDNDSWLRKFRDPSGNSAVPLVVFPHAGGSASYYRELARSLSDSFDVYVAQYPGRQDRLREPAIETIGGLADGLRADVLNLGGPSLVLFGHSMGALVAYELARSLERCRREPLLLVSGRRSPTLDIRDRVDPEDEQSILKELDSFGAEHSAFTLADIRELLLPSLQADYRALLAYHHNPSVPLTSRLHAYLGDIDPRVSPAEAQEWSRCTVGDFSLTVFEGNHFYFRENSEALVSEIKKDVELWLTRPGPTRGAANRSA